MSGLWYVKDGTLQRRGREVPTPPVTGGTWVGGHVSRSGTSDNDMFQEYSAKKGPWTVTRTFPWPPGIYGSLTGRTDVDVVPLGLIPWPSISTNSSTSWAAIASGQYDDTLEQLAAWFPTDRPTYITFQHEWENHLDAGTMTDHKNMYRHVYPIMKAVNPNLMIVPISLGYAWNPWAPASYCRIGREDEGFPGEDYCDGLAIDQYGTADPKPDGSPTLIHEIPRFQTWFQWASSKGLPLHVTEWAHHYTGGDNKRATAITADGEWFIEKGFESIQYWDSDSGAGGAAGTADWNVDDNDPLAQAALRALAEKGRKLP